MKISKFSYENKVSYGLVEETGVKPITNCSTIGELYEAITNGTLETADRVNLDDAILLPPTDETASLYCAGLNYRDHADEVNMPVPAEPVFFCKARSCLNAPDGDIIVPEGVKLLDHEIELAIVIGKKIGAGTVITENTLPDYALGITIMNDISDREVQLTAGQWFLGKSYRGFAPLGPYIEVLTGEVAGRLDSLELELQVYDPAGQPYPDKNQLGSTKNMVFYPADLVRHLQAKLDLYPGDVIATGTPAGVALGRPSRLKLRLAEIFGFSQKKRLDFFIKNEVESNRRYLSPGDTVTARIFSKDGSVDCGMQRNRVIKSDT